jgi:hypothetical protein
VSTNSRRSCCSSDSALTWARTIPSACGIAKRGGCKRDWNVRLGVPLGSMEPVLRLGGGWRTSACSGSRRPYRLADLCATR